MFCIHCGAPNPNDAAFCSSCGKAIGVAANPPAPAETTPALPAQPPPQVQAQYPPPAREGSTLPWILLGFAACLVVVLVMALGFRQNQAPAAAPVAVTLPATAPASTDTAPAAPSAPVQTPAPAPAIAPPAAPPPAPAAPQNTIVGDWRTTTVVGSHISLHFGVDGRYTLTDFITSEGVYAYSSGDGALRLQSDSIFSKGIMVWSCQVLGDSLSCVDAQGAGHAYTRIQQQ